MKRLSVIGLGLAIVGLVTSSGRAVSPLIETRSVQLANPASITFDGLDGDWAAPTLYTPDATGEAGGGTDWEYVRFANDATYLYGYFKTANNGLAAGDLQFWFDMDENQGTGLAAGALPVGADNLILVFGGSVNLTNSAAASIGFLDSQPGEAVAFTAVPGGGFGLEFKILRSRLADDGNPGFDWWANSYIGGGTETYPHGTVDANGPHNKYVFAGAVVPPPVGSYVYETNGAIANPPTGAAVLADPSRTKLTDGIASNTNWLNAPNQWVGVQDPAFVPANLAGDTELPQPRVEFLTDPSQPIASVTITYLVENDAKIHAPDYVVVSYSNGGGAFGGDVVDFGFDNSPDGFPNPPFLAEGAIRTLTIPLGGITADKVRLDFFNDFEWTAIGEIKFNTVPEPSTWVLCAIGGVAAVIVRRRRRNVTEDR